TGRYRCRSCRRSFAVTTLTPFSRTHLPVWKIVKAFCVVATGSSHISARQLHFLLGVSYQTAWELSRKIRQSVAAADQRFGPTTDHECRVIRAIRAGLSPSESQPTPWCNFGHLGLRWDTAMKPSAPQFMAEDKLLGNALSAASSSGAGSTGLLVISESGLRLATHLSTSGTGRAVDMHRPLPIGCLAKPIAAHFA